MGHSSPVPMLALVRTVTSNPPRPTQKEHVACPRAKRTASNVATGTRVYQLSIPSKRTGGRAILDFTVTDAAGNTKHLTKAITTLAKRS